MSREVQKALPGVELPEVRILGMKVTPATKAEVNRFIGDAIDGNRKDLVLNVNVHCINLAYRNAWLRDFLNSAPMVFCDGAGVRWGARMLGQRIPERITYADWMWELADFCEGRGYSLYFLGARPGIAERAADELRRKYPKLAIVGHRNGFFDMDGPENEDVIREINQASPDILVLGLGMPRQEAWLKDNWNRVDAKVALTGGACFDFVSGTMPRCPRFMADHSLEWLYRLYVEPKRMFRRYVIGNPLFMLRVILEKARMGLKAGKR